MFRPVTPAARLSLGGLIWALALFCGCAGPALQTPEAPSPAPALVASTIPPQPLPAPTPAAAMQTAVNIGKMTVYRAARGSAPDKNPPAGDRAEVDAVVCLGEGILDYLIVPPDSGKEYETLLRMEAQPSELHAALLALGARSGPLPPELRGDNRGAPPDAGNPPAERIGDRVAISVRWGQPGQEEEVPVERWLRDRATGKAANGLTWVFTGSFFGKYPDGEEIYVGNVERLAVAIWYHAACVLNLGVAAGNPYRGEKLGFEINRAAVPPVGTPVRLIFRVLKKE